jgi:lipopolysaccharide export system permease protein
VTLRGLAPDRLDLYTLRHLAGPLLLALLTLLLAQLLERLLRLIDLAAATGAALSSVLAMAANLVPHYLGLALPTAFTAGIFMAVARMGDDNELDVMLATGRSITRVAMPYFGLALLLCLFNIYLFGFLQPLSRYGYHVAIHDAQQAGWNARVEENRFVHAGHGFTLAADRVGPDGRQLQGVLVQRAVAGTEEITTARKGRLVPSADGTRLLLELDEGLTVREDADAAVSLLQFQNARINEDFSSAPPPFRERGDSVRELTLPELWHGERVADREFSRGKIDGEFHGRLARSLILPLLPLLALPLGMASKRGRRAPGVVFACLALLALNHALQFGESLAESGRAAAIPAVWSPVLVFGLFSLWLFRGSLAFPGDNPVIRLVSAIESSFQGVGAKRKRKST